MHYYYVLLDLYIPDENTLNLIPNDNEDIVLKDSGTNII